MREGAKKESVEAHATGGPRPCIGGMDNDIDRDNDIAAVLTAPSGLAAGLAAGLVAATALCWVAPVHFGAFWLIAFSPPLYLGTIVGLFSLHRPVRNALAVLWLLMVVATLLSVFHAATTLFMLALLATPTTTLGAACGGTIRRYAHARRVSRAMTIRSVSDGARSGR